MSITKGSDLCTIQFDNGTVLRGKISQFRHEWDHLVSSGIENQVFLLTGAVLSISGPNFGVAPELPEQFRRITVEPLAAESVTPTVEATRFSPAEQQWLEENPPAPPPCQEQRHPKQVVLPPLS